MIPAFLSHFKVIKVISALFIFDFRFHPPAVFRMLCVKIFHKFGFSLFMDVVSVIASSIIYLYIFLSVR